MADYFGQSPNFVNPAYATPEQLATQRAYAAELMKRSGEGASRPTGVIGNALSSVAAMLERRRADEIQSQAASENAGHMTALIQQLQRGQSPDAANVARMTANPMISPEQRDLLIRGLIQPKAVEDVAGRPGFASPVQGVKAAPVDPNFQPGIRPGLSTPDASISAVPQPAPMPRQPAPQTPPGMTRLYPQETEDWRRANPLPAAVPGGGGQAPAAALPTAPVPAMPLTLDALAKKGRELAAERTLTQAGAGAQGEGNVEDIKASTAAPAVIKGLGLIKSTIEASPGITFGPTAGWSADAKRVIANYAPGLSDEKSLAGADAIEKLNFGLASQLAKTVGGTQGELFKAIGSTPGTEKSKQGTLALIDMMQQDQMKAQQLGGLYRQYEREGRLSQYPDARERFLRSNPVINPLTNRPIEMDIKSARETQGANRSGGPSPGSIHNGYRFKGGNPNDRNSWEPVT